MTDPIDRVRAALAGSYAIVREVGQGGMATVYLANDLKHDREVALKVLRPELAAAMGADRFLREIRIVAQLSHPHILPLHDSGEADGLLFYVMPFVDGESLREKLQRDGAFTVHETVRILREVADALAYAHGRGIVHRDIKPDNVMLSRRHAIVTDFGVAKAVSEASDRQLTTVGVALGTPAYMSPEQATGEDDIDHRSDIYSLGALGYEMLAGAPPFGGPTPQAVVAKHFTEPVPSLRAARGELPESVEQLVQRTLAKSADDRFATGAELIDAITAVGSGAALTAAAASPPRSRSVAVLPFRSVSVDPENEIFADGIAEEISSALTRLGSLRVAARTSAFAYKGTGLDVRRIGRELGVDHVLEGSVRKSGRRLRVTAQMVGVGDGYQLWSERYDREMDDIFAIQDDIAGSVVEALRIVLTQEERRVIAAIPAAEIRAYEYYLRGRQQAHRLRREGYEAALKLYARAVEFDPGYAPAYAGMAECYTWLYLYLDASEQNLRLADEASARALELGPDSAEAHAARGIVISLGRRFEAARGEFETALRLAPGLYEAHYLYARACFAEGLLAEAAEQFERASALRPEDYVAPSLLATVYDALGERGKGDETRRRAVAAGRRQLELYPQDTRALYLGAGDLRRLGEEAEAVEWAARALAAAGDDPSAHYNLACFYALGGDAERAFGNLERAVELGYAHRGWVEHDEDLASLRESPRFAALLARLR